MPSILGRRSSSNLSRKLSSSSSSVSFQQHKAQGKAVAAAAAAAAAAAVHSSPCSDADIDCNSSTHSCESGDGLVNLSNKPLDPPILVYHESARSIVFRDHLRRAVHRSESSSLPASSQSSSSPLATELKTDHSPSATTTTSATAKRASFVTRSDNQKQIDEMETIATIASEVLDPNDTVLPSQAGIPETQIAGFQPRIVPLPALDLGPEDVFQPLLHATTTLAQQEQQQQQDAPSSWTPAEQRVVQRLYHQTCVVKNIKNTDWTDFLQRFLVSKPASHGRSGPTAHDDIPPKVNVTAAPPPPENDPEQWRRRSFNSFVTSTTLLPPGGRKMRSYGSHSQYTVGVVFALPTVATTRTNRKEDEDSALTLSEEQEEAAAAEQAELWSWPAGYSAKTEFNIDGRGKLINGRQEALVPLSVLRQYNRDYVHKEEYMVGHRLVKGLNQIPYNEVFLRVGGPGPTAASGNNESERLDQDDALRSFDNGVGLPIALFVRSATYGHLLSLLRTRSRMMHALGGGVNTVEDYCKHLPLLLITPEHGVSVLTEAMQKDLWQRAARNLNPFQNPSIAHRTTMSSTDERSFQQKVDELLDLDESIRGLLTPQELARLAGGFGATDASVAQVLQDVMMEDRKLNQQYRRHSRSQEQKQQHHRDQEDEANDDDDSDHQHGCHHSSKTQGVPLPPSPSHKLQDVVNEGLAAAVRAGDYHTSRQLLILYSLVASMPEDSDEDDEQEDEEDAEEKDEEEEHLENHHKHHADGCSGDESKTDADSAYSCSSCSETSSPRASRSSSLGRDLELMQKDLDLVVQNSNNKNTETDTATAGPLSRLPAPPPPPPLDTDRLRSATNSDGLLAVLGAAQVLKVMQDGGALKRVQESIDAVLEWVNYGEQSLAFRISSWYDQRAAQDDLKIAMENNSSFMAFVSNKAISNRKAFAEKLTVATEKFTDPAAFLSAIHQVLLQMHSPCLRLELLQYVLGLDNRYSVAHVTRSVELAAACLGMGRLQQQQQQQQHHHHHHHHHDHSNELARHSHSN